MTLIVPTLITHQSVSAGYNMRTADIKGGVVVVYRESIVDAEYLSCTYPNGNTFLHDAEPITSISEDVND